MGRIRIVGDVSSKEYRILEETSGELKIKNATDGVDLLKAGTTVVDASGISLCTHASRHTYGAADAIPTDGLRASQLRIVFGSGVYATITAGGTYIVPEGIYYGFLGANTRNEVYDDKAAAWKTAIAAGGVGLIFSDGSNVRLINAGTVAETSNLRPIV